MDEPTSRTLDKPVARRAGIREGLTSAYLPHVAERLHLFWVLSQRFRADRLGMTAGSLTFTTLIALVPLLTVTLALFTAFPMFSTFQGALERLLLQNLVPDTIARPVLSALSEFAGKASRMGALGLAALAVTALALMMTIDRTLNAIWRVRRPRPLGRRLLIYWAALTVGPLALGASLTLTSTMLSATRGWMGAIPGGFGLLFDLVQFALLVLAAAGLFYFVPNTEVRWRHALAGGLFVGVAIEVAKKGLVWYVGAVPMLTSVYGAFSILPILLLWVYLLWVAVLLGAVVAAYAPVLLGRAVQPLAGPGRDFRQALAVLASLDQARRTPAQGLDLTALAAALEADALALEGLLEQLAELDWVSRLDEPAPTRWVLLADPQRTPAAPLVDTLLLAPDEMLQAFRARAGLETLTLADLLPASGRGTQPAVSGA
ncbi:MAG: YihY family inner membrane protein [Betaproteobacteria bacterium]|jgi:membrane protein